MSHIKTSAYAIEGFLVRNYCLIAFMSLFCTLTASASAEPIRAITEEEKRALAEFSARPSTQEIIADCQEAIASAEKGDLKQYYRSPCYSFVHGFALGREIVMLKCDPAKYAAEHKCNVRYERGADINEQMTLLMKKIIYLLKNPNKHLIDELNKKRRRYAEDIAFPDAAENLGLIYFGLIDYCDITNQSENTQ